MEFKYKIDNGEATITGIKNWFRLPTIIDIPESIDGYPVTEINYSAFWGHDRAISIIIPITIINIEHECFWGCNSINEINGVKLENGLCLINNRHVWYDRDIFKINHQIGGDYHCSAGDFKGYIIDSIVYRKHFKL